MSEVVYCGSCGGEIAAGANFCKHCGANQAEFREEPATTPMAAAPVQQPPPQPEPPQAEPPRQQPPPPPQPEPPQAEPPPAAAQPQGARANAERVAPGAGDLADELAKRLRTPGVALAGIAALAGLGVCLVAGLVLAIVTPNASFLSLGGDGLLTETLAQAASFTQANLGFAEVDATVRFVPVLFVLVPILGVAFGAAAAAERTAGMPSRDRFLWAAGAGIPFAFGMLIIALSAGSFQVELIDSEVEFSAGSVFLLSLIWGALGGALGMLDAVRREGAAPRLLRPGQARLARAAWAGLRPLLLALIVVGVVGTAIWVVQVTRDSDYRDFPPRSTAVAIGEQVAYAGDHAIDMLPLGAGANERLSGNYPSVPIALDRYLDLAGGDVGEGSTPTYNVFDYSDTMSVALFVPLLLFLVGTAALLALYAGFAVARALGETSLERAAAWGATVGPLWALTMVLLAALARKSVVGDPTGDSVFVAFLLGGAVLGALGGALSSQSAAADGPARQAP